MCCNNLYVHISNSRDVVVVAAVVVVVAVKEVLVVLWSLWSDRVRRPPYSLVREGKPANFLSSPGSNRPQWRQF